MKVLVIVPTHDRTQFIDEAQESLEGQTRKADFVRFTGNVGPGRITDDSLASRLNYEIENTDCDAFVMLSDDDRLDPCFLQKTAECMEVSGVDIVYTDCRIFGDRTCKAHPPGRWIKEDIERNTVPLVTSLCSKAAWRKAGGYADVPMFDWHFWWKCFYTGATAKYIREPLFWYREHNVQSKFEDQLKSRAFILDLHNRLRSQFTNDRAT